MPRPYSIPTRYRRNPYHNTKADRQRIFSIVWEWFVTRKHPCCDNGGTCMYRLTLGDGTKNACAVGIFIPSCASPDILEFMGGVDKLFKEFPSQMARIFDEDLMGFLEALQDAHDTGTWASRMVANLRDVADDHNLTIPQE